MKIDLRKLYSYGEEEINEELLIPEDLYQKVGIKHMDKVMVNGKITIDYDDNIVLDLILNGKMIMPCAISLEDVEVPLSLHINETIEEKEEKNDFTLDLFDILWENIVLEIPIRVVKKGIQRNDLQGEGWKFETAK